PLPAARDPHLPQSGAAARDAPRGDAAPGRLAAGRPRIPGALPGGGRPRGDAGDGRMTEGAAAMPQDCEPAASGLEEPDPAPALAALAEGAPVDAFAWLGPHRGADGGWRLRVLFPGARAVAVRTRDGGWSALRGASVDGAFEG